MRSSESKTIYSIRAVANGVFLPPYAQTNPDLARTLPLQSTSLFVATFIFAILAAVIGLTQPAVAQGVPVLRSSIDIPSVTFDHEEPRPSFWRFSDIRPFHVWLAYLILDPGSSGEQRRAIVAVDDRKDPKVAFFLTGERPVRVPEIAGTPLRQRLDNELTTRAGLVSGSLGPISIDVGPAGANKRVVKLTFRDSLANFEQKFGEYPCLTVPQIISIEEGERRKNFAILLPEQDRSYVEFDPRCRGDADFVRPPRFYYLQPAKLRFAFSNSRFVLVQGPWIVSLPYAISERDIEQSEHLAGSAQIERLLSETTALQRTRTTPYAADGAMQHAIDLGLSGLLARKSGGK